jgi:hypothetical protein
MTPLPVPRSPRRAPRRGAVNVQRPQAQPRTNDVDRDEPRSTLRQRGPAITNHDHLTPAGAAEDERR